MTISRVGDASLYSILLKNDIATDEFIGQQPRLTIEDNDIGVVSYTNYPILNDENIKRYRPEYDYASIKLFSYKDKEEDTSKLGVVYELMVEIKNNYYVLEQTISSNGDAVFKNLAIGQKYYIRASDIGSQYKSQMVDFTPTEKDSEMEIVLLTTYNLASNEGFSYFFLLKNVIDDNPYLYIENQPKLYLYKIDSGKYVIVGTPSDRVIKLNIEHEKDLMVHQEKIELTIEGNIDPLRPSNNIIYQAPYRLLMESEPNIDTLLNDDPYYSKVIVLSEYMGDRNSSYVLYSSKGNESYIEELIYNHTTTFNLDGAVELITNKFKIKNIKGNLNTDDILIAGAERMLVLSYNASSKEVIVERGIDGTYPQKHEMDTIIYVEQNNIVQNVFNNTLTNFNITARSFSSELPVNAINNIPYTSTGTLSKPFGVANFTINDEYFVSQDVQGTVNLKWSSRNRKSNRIIGYYNSDNIDAENGVSYTVKILDTRNNILKEIKNISITSIDVDINNITNSEIILYVYVVKDGIEYNGSLPHTCYILFKKVNFIIPSQSTYIPPVGIVNFKFT